MMDIMYLGMLLGMVACCLKGPRWAIAAMAFLLPISRRLPSLPIPLLNTENLIVLVPLALLLFGSSRSARGGKVRFAPPMLIFLVLVTASLINTLAFFTPRRHLIFWDPFNILIAYKNLITCFLCYVVGCVAVKDREDLRIMLLGLGGGMAFESLFVCAEVVVNGPARANGHLFEANSAGAYLAWAFITALGVFVVLGFRTRLGKAALGTAGAAGFGLLFTLSRGNWVAGIVSGSIISLLKDRRVFVAIVLLLAASPWWIPENVKERFENTFIDEGSESEKLRKGEETDESQSIIAMQERLLGDQGEAGEPEEGRTRLDGSSQIRLFVWQAAIQMIQDHPLGVGYGVFPWVLGDYSNIARWKATHNTWLQVAAEEGILGVAIFLLFVLLLLWESWMVFLKVEDPLLKGLGLAAFGSTISMMISVCFYNFFFIIQINGQQWLLLGIVTQLRRIAAMAPETPAAVPAAEPGPVPLYRLLT